MSETDSRIFRFWWWALTKWSNLLPSAAAVAVGIAVGFWPVIAAGVALYVVLVVATLRSDDEARKFLAERNARRRGTLGRPDGPALPAPALSSPYVMGRFEEVGREEDRIREGLRDSPIDLPEVEIELTNLRDETLRLCLRTDAIERY